jgi:hypothetical protein
MLAGVALIVVGLGLLWSARDAGDVNRDVARWQSQKLPPGRRRRWFEMQARTSPAVSVWTGRLFAAAAFVGGLILLLRG